MAADKPTSKPLELTGKELLLWGTYDVGVLVGLPLLAIVLFGLAVGSSAVTVVVMSALSIGAMAASAALMLREKRISLFGLIILSAGIVCLLSASLHLAYNNVVQPLLHEGHPASLLYRVKDGINAIDVFNLGLCWLAPAWKGFQTWWLRQSKSSRQVMALLNLALATGLTGLAVQHLISIWLQLARAFGS